MASPFEIRSSNVKAEIESVTPNDVTGFVDIQFKVKDPRIANFKLILAQYDLGGGYLDMTLLPNEERDNITVINKDVDTPAKGEYKSYMIVWDSGEDLTLINRTGINVKIQCEDTDGADDTENIFGDTIAIDLLPVISKHPLPLEFLKDFTPEIVFQVPGSVKPCNMHFTLTVADNEALDTPEFEADSEVTPEDWEFQDSGGTYRVFLTLGCPDISALMNNARVRYTVPSPLALDTWYYAFTVKTATKKVPVEELDINPEDMEYPENY